MKIWNINTPPYGDDVATWPRGLTEILWTSEPSLRLGSDAHSTLTEQCLWPIQTFIGYLSGLRPSDNGPPGQSMTYGDDIATWPRGLTEILWTSEPSLRLGSDAQTTLVEQCLWPMQSTCRAFGPPGQSMTYQFPRELEKKPIIPQFEISIP